MYDLISSYVSTSKRKVRKERVDMMGYYSPRSFYSVEGGLSNEKSMRREKMRTFWLLYSGLLPEELSGS